MREKTAGGQIEMGVTYECCDNCRYKYTLHMYDRRFGGQHENPHGYVCLQNADKHLAIWIVGVDPEHNKCARYEAGENNAQ